MPHKVTVRRKLCKSLRAEAATLAISHLYASKDAIMRKSAVALAATVCALSMPAIAMDWQFGGYREANIAGVYVCCSAGELRFTVRTHDLATYFNSPNAFVRSIAFNIEGDPPDYGSGVLQTGVTGEALNVRLVNGGGPGGDRFELSFLFGEDGSNRLDSNEFVRFIWQEDITNTGWVQDVWLEVDGIGDTSIWMQPLPPIPEPSTYALMLSGLAAVALIARRRRHV